VKLAGALQRHPRVIGTAAGAAVDVTGPDVVCFRLHVDEHALAPGRRFSEREATQCRSTAFDADHALGACALPFAERQIGRLVVAALWARHGLLDLRPWRDDGCLHARRIERDGLRRIHPR